MRDLIERGVHIPTVRLRRRGSKGPGNCAAGLAMVFALAWIGGRFEKGLLIERRGEAEVAA